MNFTLTVNSVKLITDRSWIERLFLMLKFTMGHFETCPLSCISHLILTITFFKKIGFTIFQYSGFAWFLYIRLNLDFFLAQK